LTAPVVKDGIGWGWKLLILRRFERRVGEELRRTWIGDGSERALTCALRIACYGLLGWLSVAWAGGQAPAGAPARFVVVLDAAHGGEDGGARLGSATSDSDAPGQGGGEVEKNVTLAMSVRLRSLLMARGFQVVTTREGNVSLDADARAQIANRAVAGAGNGAACLILHATEMGSGVHLFVSSLAPTGLGTTGLGRFLPWKTAQSAYVSRSLKLAGQVNSALEHVSAGGGPITATLKRASLPGLDSMTCPAVAIEIAPIRGGDRKVLTEVTDPEYQTQVVEALAAALLEWKTDTGADLGPGSSPASSSGSGPGADKAGGRQP